MRWPKCAWVPCGHPAAWCSRKTGKFYCGVEHGGPTYFQKKWAEMDQPLFGPPIAVLEQTARTNAGVSPFCLALKEQHQRRVREFVAGLELQVRCDLSFYPHLPGDEDGLAALVDWGLIDDVAHVWTPWGNACGQAVRP